MGSTPCSLQSWGEWKLEEKQQGWWEGDDPTEEVMWSNPFSFLLPGTPEKYLSSPKHSIWSGAPDWVQLFCLSLIPGRTPGPATQATCQLPLPTL